MSFRGAPLKAYRYIIPNLNGVIVISFSPTKAYHSRSRLDVPDMNSLMYIIIALDGHIGIGVDGDNGKRAFPHVIKLRLSSVMAYVDVVVDFEVFGATMGVSFKQTSVDFELASMLQSDEIGCKGDIPEHGAAKS